MLIFLLCCPVLTQEAGGYKWMSYGLEWTSGTSWTSVGLLALDPARPATLFAVTDTDGVYRTDCGMEGWHSINDGLEDRQVCSLAVAATIPTTVYAGTASGKIFKTQVDRSCWETVASFGAGSGGVVSMAVSPAAPERIYAGTLHAGVFRSQDGGAHWQAAGLAGQPVYTLSITAGPSPVIFAGSDSAGVFRSTNDGGSWQTRGLAHNTRINCLVVTPQSPLTLYAGTAWGNVFRSTDGGGNWQSVLQCNSIQALAVDGKVSGRVLVSDDFATRESLDGGQSWTIISTLSFSSLLIDPSHPWTLYAASTRVSIAMKEQNPFEWECHGPLGGNVRSIVVDPRDSGTLLAGLYRKGVFRSIDGGMHWEPRNQGLYDGEDFNNYLTAIVMSPANPDLLFAVILDGPARSTDGGNIWTRIHIIDRGYNVRGIFTHPLNADIVYAGTVDGFMKSTNRGITWTAQPGAPASLIQTLVFNPTDPNLLLAGTNAQGVYRSSDGGQTWSPAIEGLTGLDVRALCADLQTPGLVYAGTYSRSIYRSWNWGGAWEKLGYNFRAPVIDIKLDPFNPMDIFAATMGNGIFRSSDRGQSWQPIDEGLSNPEIQCLAADPHAPGTFFAGASWAGLSRTTDAGAHWRSAGVALSAVNALEVNPRNSQELFAATSEDGCYRSASGGLDWQPVSRGLTDVNVTALGVDPWQPSNMYAGTFTEGVFRSEDGGISWNPISDGLIPQNGYIWVSALVVDPKDPAVLYVSIQQGILKSSDSGDHWSMSCFMSPAKSMVVDPTDSRRVYFVNSGLYMTTDAGATWTGAPIENFCFYRLMMLPGTPSMMFAAVEKNEGTGGWSSGVARTVDQASSWTFWPVPYVSVFNVLANSSNPDILYAGGADSGAYQWVIIARSGDGGRHWVPISEGIPATSILAMAFDPEHRSTVYIATDKGVFSRNFEGSGDMDQNGVTDQVDDGVLAGILVENAFRSRDYFLYTVEPGDMDGDGRISLVDLIRLRLAAR